MRNILDKQEEHSERERVVLYRQYIRTKEYQMSLVEEHLRTCGNSKFQIFPFFKLRLMDKINRETHESTYIIHQAAKTSIESTKLINLIIAQNII